MCLRKSLVLFAWRAERQGQEAVRAQCIPGRDTEGASGVWKLGPVLGGVLGMNVAQTTQQSSHTGEETVLPTACHSTPAAPKQTPRLCVSSLNLKSFGLPFCSRETEVQRGKASC